MRIRNVICAVLIVIEILLSIIIWNEILPKDETGDVVIGLIEG